MAPDPLTRYGNRPMVSIGIEPPEKLIKDIKQALACVAQGVTLNG